MQSGTKIVSVKELTRYLKLKLDGDDFLQDVWVRGEISNFTLHSSGHMYFTLKDAESRIKCIMFASHNQRLGFLPRDGAKVIARGDVSVYERDGQYQLYVVQMQPDGLGNLYLAFEQLKAKLSAEGLFDPARKKPIPKFPRAIGVITSPTGAAIRDILTTLGRRQPSVPVLLYPVLVQGEQAAPSIVRAIETMNRLREVDVLIVGRGGGSLEELWAFNEESVARSIAASSIPIISAVGHETDFTIADFVADLRAPTPTAAAELAVPHHLELKQHLAHLRQRLLKGLLARVQIGRDRLDRLCKSPVFTQPRRYLLQPAERLDRENERLKFRMKERLSRARESLARLDHRVQAHSPKEKLALSVGRIQSADRRMIVAMRNVWKEQNQWLTSIMRQLDALSPLKVMSRGYGLIFDENERRLIKSVRQVQLGDLLKVVLTDGKLECHVWGMEDKADEQSSG
jgi:exodeoxyribonuclease VII large subunit